MPATTIGWDIGGAHLKAVYLDQEGTIEAVHQVACPLWQGIEKLDEAYSRPVSRVHPPCTRLL